MEEIEIPKEVQQKNSAEIVASIDDLLIVILLRLPIKSLLRFKSVSKHWQSLIANPKFCYLRNRTIGLMLPHDDIPINGRLIEYVPFFDTALTRKLEYLKDAELTEVLHSCNGLLLCISYFDNECIRYVCNPTTNKLSLVPALEKDNWSISGMSLAFDPAISPHYKVVCVQKLGKLARILTCSSETVAWVVCGDPFTCSINCFRKGVYWNGALHWMSHQIPLYFKIEDQVVGEMPSVPVPLSIGWNVWDKYYFGESCDHLHFVKPRDTQLELNVYEMKRDYSEWFIKYKVDLLPVIAAYPEIIRDLCYYDFSVFCIVTGGKEEEDESFMVLEIPAKVIRLNLVSKTFKSLYEFEVGHYWYKRRLKFAYTSGFQYIESLCNV
ncbi:hypothetical protein ACJIZ3_009412 [Penstemon smallii]|uniref:F-box domain-containing protein n=1 Tax=Penstemon smallii TaxID=265156 RepID=A0ABD3TDI7_9LAMI